MKSLYIMLATLLLSLCIASATTPTGTVTRAVTVTTNGVLWGSDTNFPALNGIATTAQVAAVELQALSGISSAGVAQATADGKVGTNDARVINSTTNVTGGVLSWANGVIELTATAISNAIAGVYSLAGHLHQWTEIGGLGDASTNSASAFATAAEGLLASNALPRASLTDGSLYELQLQYGLKLYEAGGCSNDAQRGSIQSGDFGADGLIYIASGSGAGTFQAGYVSYGRMAIGDPDAPARHDGAMQRGYVWGGNMLMGYGGVNQSAWGAYQAGVLVSASATNNARGSIQIFDLTTGQSAYTTEDGDGSILLGAGVASNRYSIVAGDGQASHGDGSITAGGGFYGSGSGLSGMAPSQIGAAWHTNTVITLVETNELGAVTNITSTTLIYLGAP